MTSTLIKDRDKKQMFQQKDKVTLVFDAGMGNWSLFFEPIVQQVSTQFNICLLSRNGYLDPFDSKAGRDSISIAKQIDQTLKTNQIDGPIILVGHSVGGLHVRMFQHEYPEKVIALVLLDAAHPNLYMKMPELKINIERQIHLVKRMIMFSSLGLFRFAKHWIPTFGLPQELFTDYFKVTCFSNYYRAYRAELEAFAISLKQCRNLTGLNDLPLLVLYSRRGINSPGGSSRLEKDDVNKKWLELQKDLSKLSTNSTYIESFGDHFLHLTDTKATAQRINDFLLRVGKK